MNWRVSVTHWYQRPALTTLAIRSYAQAPRLYIQLKIVLKNLIMYLDITISQPV
jgi:hypothetical protein